VKRAGFVLSIRPERVEDYVKAHANVWPEMRAAIRDAGIGNYSIFLRDNEAFGYLEAEDVDQAFARLTATDVNRRWQDAMADLLDARVAERGPTLLDEIFRLD
jgi:L-rhamnose mutarotase